MATERRQRSFWFSTALLGLGAAAFFYAQALAAFILPQCPRFALDAPGECGLAYRLDVGGIALALLGLLGYGVLVARHCTQSK